MLATNPFAALSAFIPPATMQAYLVLMIVLVAAGTIFDIVHKGSARYFFDNWRRTKGKARDVVGGYWFWFFIRVDVAAEGSSPFRVMRADLFVLSLVASVTLGVIWAWAQASGSAGSLVWFALYILATTVLFGSVPWSKFAHMFFKPAAAFEKRVANANGTRANLPSPADKPEQFGSARTAPRHY